MKRLLYRIRRWLVWKLVPKTLFIFLPENAISGDGASVFDPVEMKPWAKAVFADAQYLGKFKESIEPDRYHTCR